MTTRGLNITGLIAGAAFGFLIYAAGFGNADFIHRMLLLQNAYPYLVFAAAVATGVPLFWLFEKSSRPTLLGGNLRPTRTPFRRRQVYGGALFGAAWAFSATCPVPALAMVASGGVLGLFVVAGLFVGVSLGERRARDVHGAARPPVPANPNPAVTS